MCNLIQDAINQTPSDKTGVIAYYYVNPAGKLMQHLGNFFAAHKSHVSEGVTFADLEEEKAWLEESGILQRVSLNKCKHEAYGNYMLVVSRG